MEIVAAILLSALGCYFMKRTGAPLKELRPGIVRLEVALSVRQVNAILKGWKEQKPHQWKDLLLESLKWDTGFILSYAPLLCLLCWMAADHFATSCPTLSEYLRIVAAAQLLAGGCDFLENAGMRRTIVAEAGTAPWVQVTGSASIVKWTLIAAGVFSVLYAAGDYMATRLCF